MFSQFHDITNITAPHITDFFMLSIETGTPLLRRTNTYSPTQCIKVLYLQNWVQFLSMIYLLQLKKFIEERVGQLYDLDNIMDMVEGYKNKKHEFYI